MSIPKIVAADTPDRGLLWSLVDENLDLVPEVKLVLDWKAATKQREIDLLSGKLTAASSLTDAERRRTLTSALQRLAALGIQRETGAG